MELVFEKQGDVYVAEFEVTSDFNLHIEKEVGVLYTYQRGTSEGMFDFIDGLSMRRDDVVLDIDVTALVYPKTIQIKSYGEITKAVVTTKS